MTMPKIIEASRISPPARVLAGDDNMSHIVDMCGDLWCERELDMYEDVDDVNCPDCIALFLAEE